MYLYILFNKVRGKYYIGISNNLERRLKQHNSPNWHYTGKGLGTWQVLFSKWFESKIEARKEEIRLKKAKNRKYLEWYISQELGP